jgi:hypothetical protein
MKNIYATLILVLFLNLLYAQPVIQWQNTIGGSDQDDLRAIQQTTDAGYILGGTSVSNISGDKTENSQGGPDYWVVKLDSTGVIQWQNTIGGNNSDDFFSIDQTADGGYILGGYSQSDSSGDKTENGIGEEDCWVIKLDSAGNIQWENTIGGTLEDELLTLKHTADKGYILGCSSYSNISGDKTENSLGNWDYWIIKLDSAGNITWQNTIGGSMEEHVYSIQQTSDSGYIVGGASTSSISGDKTENCQGNFDYWIVKLDTTGNIQWQNTIGGSNLDKLYSMQQTNDGGYILGGNSNSNISGDKTENSQGGNDYWAIKLDSTGNIQWQNTIGGSGDDNLYSVKQTSDGGYFLGGYSNSSISGDKTENCIGTWDYWIVKLDSTGIIQWQNTIGGNIEDNLQSVQQTIDNGYILGGFSNSDISGDKTENSQGGDDYWIIKLYPDSITGISNLQISNSNYNISPNPTSSILNLFLKERVDIIITNTLGEIVLQKKEKGKVKLDVSFLAAGIYFIRAGNEVRKFMKE